MTKPSKNPFPYVAILMCLTAGVADAQHSRGQGDAGSSAGSKNHATRIDIEKINRAVAGGRQAMGSPHKVLLALEGINDSLDAYRESLLLGRGSHLLSQFTHQPRSVRPEEALWTISVALALRADSRCNTGDTSLQSLAMDDYRGLWRSVQELLANRDALCRQLGLSMAEVCLGSMVRSAGALPTPALRKILALLREDSGLRLGPEPLHQELTAHLRVATAALTLSLWDAEGKSLPVKMTDLPGNWIDPYTGRPLMLRVERDVFTVYSLGEDAFDQGGDWAFDIARSVPLRFGGSRK